MSASLRGELTVRTFSDVALHCRLTLLHRMQAKADARFSFKDSHFIHSVFRALNNGVGLNEGTPVTSMLARGVGVHPLAGTKKVSSFTINELEGLEAVGIESDDDDDDEEEGMRRQVPATARHNSVYMLAVKQRKKKAHLPLPLAAIQPEALEL